MSYNYQTERPFIFTEEGQVIFLKVRDKTQQLLKVAGAARSQEMIAGCTGNSWQIMACVDRLVELKEIREVSPPNVWGQHRIFINARE
jgi:hypothetical protein